MQTIAIEETLARRFRLAKAPTLVVQSDGVSPMAFTWLRDEGPFHGRTMAVPPEEAFEFQVALAPMSSGEIWVDGNCTRLHGVSPGDTFVFDLSTNPNGNLIPSPIDQNRCAQSRNPIDIIVQGWSTSLFQAKQQCWRMSS